MPGKGPWGKTVHEKRHLGGTTVPGRGIWGNAVPGRIRYRSQVPGGLSGVACLRNNFPGRGSLGDSGRVRAGGGTFEVGFLPHHADRRHEEHYIVGHVFLF